MCPLETVFVAGFVQDAHQIDDGVTALESSFKPAGIEGIALLKFDIADDSEIRMAS
jgi:hypothetical protein